MTTIQDINVTLNKLYRYINIHTLIKDINFIKIFQRSYYSFIYNFIYNNFLFIITFIFLFYEL